jgi:DNA-directed RNA polymerase subunit RPC12/RpoP
MVWQMAVTPPRTPRRAPSSVQPAASRSTPRPSQGPSGGQRALKILVAGVDKDERALVEDTVRQALGALAASEPWAVSLVRLAGKWSVTLDGPGDRFRNMSFMTDEARLRDAIREAVGGGREGAARGLAVPAVAAPATEVRDRHVCERCKRTVLVVYESQPDEPKQLAPLACPYCWTINRVEIGAWAAAGGDYRSEKA